MKRFLFACAAALSLVGAAAAQAPVQVRIGELTLSYDPSRWQVQEEGGALAAACVAEACAGIVFDMTASPEPGRHCDRREAYETAKAMFAFERYATNIHVLGDLALVMTSAANEVSLDAPSAVFGCITRDDVVYRIASRLGDRPVPARSGGYALELLRGLSAPPARQREVEIGALAISYPADRWEVAQLGEGGALLHCMPPTCRDFGARLVAGAVAETADCVAETTDADKWATEPWQVAAGGNRATLTFHATAFWSGCRHWTPPVYLACAVHEGVTYRIGSFDGAGCSAAPEVPLAAFNDLLAGARLRE